MIGWGGSPWSNQIVSKASQGGKTCAAGRAHHLIVEFFHHFPRAVADTYHDDGQRIVRGHDNGVFSFLSICDLAVGNDDQNVVRPFLLFVKTVLGGSAALATMCASRATRWSQTGLGIMEGIGCDKGRWGASQKIKSSP